MKDLVSLMDRRRLLGGGLALGAMALFAPGAFAEELARTPRMTEGPFYPDHLPLDRDNDLILIKDSTTPAVGTISHLSGRVTDVNGKPVRDAQIEIWQCDAKQVYLHSSDSGPKKAQQDQHFQGYGRFAIGSTGEYRFRTIKPVPYPGRPAPHIHFKVTKDGRELLTSQLFIDGHPGNRQDGIFRGVGDAVEQQLVTAEFLPVKDSKIGELAATFDIVIGMTPADAPARRR